MSKNDTCNMISIVRRSQLQGVCCQDPRLRFSYKAQWRVGQGWAGSYPCMHVGEAELKFIRSGKCVVKVGGKE